VSATSGPPDEAPTRSQLLDHPLIRTGPCALAFWDGGSTALTLPEQAVTFSVGRSKTCDLRVDLASVSRTHMKLHIGAPDAAGERTLAVEDLGGSTGTRINGKRMDASSTHPISFGDVVALGSAVVLVQRFGDAGVSQAPPVVQEPASDSLVLSSAAMQRLYRTLTLVASSRINVLLVGETGVGKEVAASAIHTRSPRAKHPFVAINCAAIPEALLEGELFGFERGAFTGADRTKSGLIESAHHGTLMLDEVGELPLGVQAKLLRILEGGQVRRLGSLETRTVDVRFIAATNRSLEDMVEEGKFRRDLYYRLNGMCLHLPPLRERLEDIEPMALSFLVRSAAEQQLVVPPISPNARAALRRHSWPGNIRELRNVMERALLLSQGEMIETEHLAVSPTSAVSHVHAAPGSPARAPSGPPSGLKQELNQLERERIVSALEQTGGNQTQAATLLGMSRRTLVKRLQEYNLPRPRKGRDG